MSSDTQKDTSMWRTADIVDISRKKLGYLGLVNSPKLEVVVVALVVGVVAVVVAAVLIVG